MKNGRIWALLSFFFLGLGIFFQEFGHQQFKKQNHNQKLSNFIETEFLKLENQILGLQKQPKSFLSKPLPIKPNQSFCLVKNGKAIYWQGEMHGLSSEMLKKEKFIAVQDREVKIGIILQSDTTSILLSSLKNPVFNSYFLGRGENQIALNKNQIFYTVHSDISPTWVFLYKIAYGIFFLCFSFSFFHVLRQKKQNDQMVLLLLLGLVRWLHLKGHIALFSHPIFDPHYFALSKNIPSLGDLLFHMVLGIFVLVALLSFWRTSKQIKTIGFFFTMGLFFYADMCLSMPLAVVKNASLIFDINCLDGMGVISFLALFLLSIFFLGVPILANECFLRNSKWWIVLLSFVVFFCFQWADSGKSVFELSMACLWVFFLFFLSHFKQKKFAKWSFYILLSVVLLAFRITQANQEKEDTYVHFFANKKLFAKDIETEYAFKNIENKLTDIFLQPFDLKQENTASLTEEVRNIFFFDQLNKYEISIQNFNKDKQPVETKNYPLAILEDLYNNKSSPTLSNYFFKINDPQWLNSYIAKYENCDQNGNYGFLFILLRPKRIQRGSNIVTFPKKLQKTSYSAFNSEVYPFGIYKNSRLVYQSGNYSFPDFQKHIESLVDKKRYRSWQFDFENGLSFQIIKPFRFLKTTLTLSLLLLAILSASIILFLISVWLFLRKDIFYFFPKNSIVTKTQLTSTALLFAGMMGAMYIMTRYVALSHSNRIKTDIGEKLKDVGNQLLTAHDLEKNTQETNQALSLVNKLSSEQKTNIRLFDLNGQLVASSGKVLPNSSGIAHLMPAVVYRKMEVDHYSEYLQEEQVNGKKVYSAYAPVYDAFGRKLVYLNLPYFEESNIVRKELSKLFVSFLNIYFLLILAGAVAIYFLTKRLLKPLVMIQQKMAQTSLSSKNEIIHWKRNDEIGQLIGQYNHMVEALEKNLKLLAKSEREMAWREMAKQVAHEIKNPLTPMKLNLQYLQKAIKDKDPNLTEKFKKTADSIIFQIDNMSRMASDFSNFARLPEPKNEKVDMVKLMVKNVELFQHHQKDKLIFHTDCKEAIVLCDEKNMSRIFNNLLTNSFQAIPKEKKGRIEIELKENKNHFVITVKDNGSGIPKNQTNKIFEPNFSTKTTGMGMGLAITKNLVEQAKGRISFESQFGIGTCFLIKIPKYK